MEKIFPVHFVCVQKSVHDFFIVCLCLIIIHHLGEADNSSAASLPASASIKVLKMGTSPRVRSTMQLGIPSNQGVNNVNHPSYEPFSPW